MFPVALRAPYNTPGYGNPAHPQTRPIIRKLFRSDNPWLTRCRQIYADLHRHPQRQSLENNIAIFGAVAVPAKRSQGEGKRRIVGKGGSAFQCQTWILGIRQSPSSRFDQAGELGAIRRLSLELGMD